MVGRASAGHSSQPPRCSTYREVPPLHPPPRPPDDRHDHPAIARPHVALGMVPQPAVRELGGALGEAVLLDRAAGRLLRRLGQTDRVDEVLVSNARRRGNEARARTPAPLRG